MDYEYMIYNEAKDDDDEDEGLLSHGLDKKKEKKENPLYTDYKTEQIMKGKPVKSYKGWKKERRAKRFLKAAAAIGGAIVLTKGARHIYKKRNDPVYRAEQEEKKLQRKRDRAYYNQRKKGVEKEAKEQAKTANAISTENSRHNNEKDYEEQTGKKMGFFTQAKTQGLGSAFSSLAGSVKDKFSRSHNEDLEILYSFDEDFRLEIYNALSLTESKNELDLAYEEYKKNYIAKGLPRKHMLSKRQFKKQRNSKKRMIRNVIALTGIAGAIAGNAIVKKKTGAGIVTNLKEMRNKSKAEATARKLEKDRENADIIRRSSVTQRNLGENWLELNNITSAEYESYLEALADKDFRHESYCRYCVQMEALGRTPLDEGVFDSIKDTIADYSDAIGDAIHEKRKEKADKRKKKKEEELKKESEKLEKMDPEERKEYLEKKEKNKKLKDKVLSKGVSSFTGGAMEALGKNIVNKMFN